jgi:hypothetical protein
MYQHVSVSGAEGRQRGCWAADKCVAGQQIRVCGVVGGVVVGGEVCVGVGGGGDGGVAGVCVGGVRVCARVCARGRVCVRVFSDPVSPLRRQVPKQLPLAVSSWAAWCDAPAVDVLV